MKKNLLRPMLVALLALAGLGTSWADAGDVTVNADIDFSNAITGSYSVEGAVGSMTWSQQWTYTPVIEDGIFYFGNFDGGAVELQNNTIGAKDKVTISFDLAFGKLNSKHVGFKLVDAEGNDLLLQWFDAYSGDFDDANPLNLVWSNMYRGSNTVIWERRVEFNIEFDYAAKKVTTKTKCYLSGASKAATEATAEADWTVTAPIAKFVLLGNINNSDRRHAFDNLKIQTVEGNYSAATANYTVKYVCNGTEIKDAATYTGDVDAAAALTGSDKANFFGNEEETVRYIYVSDDAEGKTIAADGSTVITVTFREAAKWAYAINSAYAGTVLPFVAEGSVWEDINTLKVQYPRFQANGNVLVKRDPVSNALTQSYTVTEDNFTQTLDYVAVAPAIENLYLLKEAENLETGLNTSATSFTDRVSGAQIIYGAKGDLLTLPAGKYIFTLGAIGGDNNTHQVAYAIYKEGTPTADGAEHNEANKIGEGTCTGNFLTLIATSEFELNEETTISFTCSDPASSRGIDLVYVQKTGDVEVAEPEYGVIWEGATEVDGQEYVAVPAAAIKALAKVNDIIRVTTSAVPEAARNEAPRKVVKTKKLVVKASEDGDDAIWEEVELNDETWTYDFVITADELAKLQAAGDNIYVGGNLVVVNRVELIEYTFDLSGVIVNADFAESTPIDNHLCGYGKDMAANNTTYYGMQDVEKWNKVILNAANDEGFEGSGVAGAVFAYGSEWQMKGNQKTAPAAGPNGEAGNALGFFAVWGCGGYYYQDVTLAAGEYTLVVPMYNQSGTQANESYTGFFVSDDVKYTVAVNPAVGAWTVQQVSFTLDETTTGQIRLGYKSNGNGSGVNPMLFIDGVKLLTPLDAAITAYETALAAANETVANDEIVTGEEKTALEQAIAANTDIDLTSLEAVQAATEALNAAVATFNAAKAAYQSLIDAKALVAGLSYKYATDEKKEAAEAAAQAVAQNADDATTKKEAVIQAYRVYAESSALAEGIENAVDMTELIANPNAEDGMNGWTLVGKANVKNNESMTDGSGKNDYLYFDSDQWGDNAWNITMSQTVTLPAGKYQLTVASRASVDLTSFNVFAGENKTEMTKIGASGGLFDRGWNDASVEIELDEETDVTVGVQGVTSTVHQWMSFTRFRLVKLGDNGTVGISELNAAAAQNGNIFNLSGQKVQNAQKGLFIINGKKVVRK